MRSKYCGRFFEGPAAMFSLLFTFLIFTVKSVYVLENSLARTPPMGWMSWGYYRCGADCDKQPHKCLNEDLIIAVADAFYNEGYQEAGYEYIIIDDCWSEKTRDEDCRLVPDGKRFPMGMKFLADYIHNRGMKFGMYTNIANITCEHYPGSRGHFKIDAETFASWGVDYLKVDGCFVKEDYLNKAYIELGQYLNQTGRPMVYSCSWPYYIQYIISKKPNYDPVARHCNLWRNYHDVQPVWESVANIIEHYTYEYKEIQRYHKPGQWNDPDMLLLGTKVLTPGQSRVQLSVFVMMSAPLLISCDMRHITPEEKRMLQNMDLMAINQDPMGIMATPHMLSNYVALWVKPHLPIKGNRYPSYSFLLVNLNKVDVSLSFTPGEFGLNSTDGYSVMDVFTTKYLMNVTLTDSLKVTVPYEDVVFYSLYPL